MEEKMLPVILGLSEWLGVTSERAQRILEKSVQWEFGNIEKGHAWSAQVGRYIIFVGSVALDGALKAQAIRMICDRVNMILPAADDALCMLGNGHAMTASEIRSDLGKWFRPNGIACSSCGSDMLDWQPDCIFYSDPLKVRIHCVECGHSDYRLFVTPNV